MIPPRGPIGLFHSRLSSSHKGLRYGLPLGLSRLQSRRLAVGRDSGSDGPAVGKEKETNKHGQSDPALGSFPEGGRGADSLILSFKIYGCITSSMYEDQRLIRYHTGHLINPAKDRAFS